MKTQSGHEVDFLAREADGAESLIQVCADIDDPDTFAREARSLREAAPEHPGARLLLLTAVSRLPFPEVPGPIAIRPAWQWMLEGGESGGD